MGRYFVRARMVCGVFVRADYIGWDMVGGVGSVYMVGLNSMF